jgi:hypothetical protein
MLHTKYLCSRHLLESDFTTAERVRLNKVTFPFGSDSASQSLPQSLVPSFHIPSIGPTPSVPSGVIQESELHDLSPTRTYRKTLVPSAVTPVPILADSPSTSFKMSALQAAAVVKETSFPRSSVNSSDVELGHINRQSSSSKPRARNSLLKELNLA